MSENHKEPDEVIEAKLSKRLKFLSAEEGGYEDYKTSIMAEEINLNKKRREELFLNKRRLFFHGAVKNFQSLQQNDKVDNLSNKADYFQDIPELNDKEIAEIKKMLKAALVDEDKYDIVLFINNISC
jgi:hypothetical protein